MSRSSALAAAVLLALAGLTGCNDLTAPPAPEPIGTEPVGAAAAKPTAAAAASSAPAPAPTPAPPPPNPNAKVTIEELAKGKGGPAAKDGDKVGVLYTGKLQNGTVFDASDRHGNKPIDFVVGKPGIIKGFSDGVRGMTLGQKRRVTIPPELGYGAQGTGPIPPNATLVFDLELAELNGQKK